MKKTKKPGKSSKSVYAFVLDGEVSFVETRNGKEVSRDVIDSKLVLELVRLASMEGLLLMEKKK